MRGSPRIRTLAVACCLASARATTPEVNTTLAINGSGVRDDEEIGPTGAAGQQL